MRKPDKYREEIMNLLGDMRDEMGTEKEMYGDIEDELMKGILIGKNMMIQKILYEFIKRRL